MQNQLSTQHESREPLPFDVYLGTIEPLWEKTPRAPAPTQLIVTPTQLHQRNIESQLRKMQRPKSSLLFRRIGSLAGDVAGSTNHPSTALDRVDRLALIREIIAETTHPCYDYLAAVIGSPLSKHIERIERTRSELELVTGFHPARMNTFASHLGEPTEPATKDTLDLLAGVSQLHHDLKRRLSTPNDTYLVQAVSETSLLCRATCAQQANPSLWADVYPSIETLSLAGMSMLTAPLEDFCRLIAATTDVDVRIFLREASGPQIQRQLGTASAVENPGSQGVFEWR